jgi:phenylacetate-CoA ligase
LRISREGTLDAAALQVTFKRDTLVKNPMWKSRIGQSLVAVTPVTIEVVVDPEVSEVTRPGSVTDLRGQHLGTDRSSILM